MTKRIYVSVGEMYAVNSVGTVSVVECSECHSLVLWSQTDAHDAWHSPENFKKREEAAHIAETERMSHAKGVSTQKRCERP